MREEILEPCYAEDAGVGFLLLRSVISWRTSCCWFGCRRLFFGNVIVPCGFVLVFYGY